MSLYSNTRLLCNPTCPDYRVSTALIWKTLISIQYCEINVNTKRCSVWKGPSRVGQGYADVLVPPVGGAAGWLMGEGMNHHPDAAINDWQAGHPNDDNANLPQEPTAEVSEEQVCGLQQAIIIIIIICHDFYDTVNISSCVSVHMSRYWARGKLGEHKRGVRVARGTAECNSSLQSAHQTSQVLNISTYAQLQHELIRIWTKKLSVLW